MRPGMSSEDANEIERELVEGMHSEAVEEHIRQYVDSSLG